MTESTNGVRHQPPEISLKGILIFAAIVVALVAIALCTIKIVFHHLDKVDVRRDEAQLADSVLPSIAIARPNFPLPREQVTPREDLAALQKRESETLDSYGWIDRNNGVIRIPIQRAMELLLQKGLPVRTNDKESTTGPSSLELQQQRPTQTSATVKEDGK